MTLRVKLGGHLRDQDLQSSLHLQLNSLLGKENVRIPKLKLGLVGELFGEMLGDMHDYQMVLIAMSATDGACLRTTHQQSLNRTSQAFRQHNHGARNAEVE